MHAGTSQTARHQQEHMANAVWYRARPVAAQGEHWRDVIRVGEIVTSRGYGGWAYAYDGREWLRARIYFPQGTRTGCYGDTNVTLGSSGIGEATRTLSGARGSGAWLL